jgi:hypothetical protein
MIIPEVYLNFSIPLADRDRVVEELRRLKRIAFVTPPQAGYVVACDQGPELGRLPTVEEIAKLYSLTLGAPIFVACCDPEAFYFDLLEGKKHTAGYQSNEIEYCVDPDDEEEIAEVIADRKLAARRLSEVLASPAVAPYVEDLLLHPERFASPVKQHAALVEALGLPTWSIGAGYHGLSAGILPVGLAAEDVIRVS